jgi:sulfate anion transporter 6
MAYSLLATLPPIYGLYTSFFPVLIYMLFGTSRHISIGSFAFASLMIARTIFKLEDKFGLNLEKNETNFTNSSSFDDTEKIKVTIAMSVTFYVGLVQMAMSFFQLGMLTVYFAEPLVNGLTTGVAVQVVVSQLKSVFGVKLKQFSGVFNLLLVIF